MTKVLSTIPKFLGVGENIFLTLFGYNRKLNQDSEKDIRSSDLKRIDKFREEHGEGGIVITKDRTDHEDDTAFIPEWVFLTIV